ncbi:hypothetical protein SAMN05216359_108111 [Roseateles sp. YR242]|nr:hypothetical protein SAMN05216359_108111 [Roseateles sp. YR242]
MRTGKLRFHPMGLADPDTYRCVTLLHSPDAFVPALTPPP